MNEITPERLREVLTYDVSTGLFHWVSPPKMHSRLRNKTAGGISSGYVMIKVDGRKYKAHRLAWLYFHGDWPEGEIDHANGCPLDNRIQNLRIATNPQNQANRRANKGKGTPKGVRELPSGRFQARISVKKKLIILGTFDKAEAAHAAYLNAAKSHYGEFARAA